MDVPPEPAPIVQPAPAPPPPRRLGAARAFGILTAYLLAQFAVGFVVLVAAQSYVGSRITDSAAIASRAETLTLLPAALIGTILGAVAAFRMTRRSFPGAIASGALRPIGWSAAPPRMLAWCALLGAVIAMSVEYLLVRHLPLRPDQSLGPVVQAAMSSGFSRLCWAILAVGVAPPAEEFLFRGVLLHGFARTWNVTVAVIVTSVLFVALHLPETRSYWPALIGISLLAAATMAVRLKSRKLLPAVAVHAGYNLALVLLVYVHMP